jgi:hypothetical protein
MAQDSSEPGPRLDVSTYHAEMLTTSHPEKSKIIVRSMRIKNVVTTITMRFLIGI